MCACIPSVTLFVDKIRTRRRGRTGAANLAERGHPGEFRRMARRFPGKFSLGTLSTLDTERARMSVQTPHAEQGAATGGTYVL